jgi:hypothetical protein
MTIALGIGIALAALVLEPATMKARLGEVDRHDGNSREFHDRNERACVFC